MYYHLNLFFTEQELSLAYSLLLLSLTLSQVVGGPAAGGLQYLEGKSGLHGWQWLFIIEGCITVLWGIAIPVSVQSRCLACNAGVGELQRMPCNKFPVRGYTAAGGACQSTGKQQMDALQ